MVNSAEQSIKGWRHESEKNPGLDRVAIEGGGHETPVFQNRLGGLRERRNITNNLDALHFAFGTERDFQHGGPLNQRVAGVKGRGRGAGHLRRLKFCLDCRRRLGHQLGKLRSRHYAKFV